MSRIPLPVTDMTPALWARAEEDRERRAFEDAAFQAYFMSCITGDMTLKSEVVPQAVFCAQAPDGSYIVATLNPAWWAWQERGKAEARRRAVQERLEPVECRGCAQLMDLDTTACPQCGNPV